MSLLLTACSAAVLGSAAQQRMNAAIVVWTDVRDAPVICNLSSQPHKLNSKTVAKAYKLLERDSIIEAKGYRGTYVHPKAKANCKFNLQEWTLRKLGEVIGELREASTETTCSPSLGSIDAELSRQFSSAREYGP